LLAYCGSGARMIGPWCTAIASKSSAVFLVAGKKQVAWL
jgi:hypothetical protein